MNEWQALKIPPFCERIIGFSIPKEEKILVISYNGAHLLQLNESEIIVETDSKLAEYNIYNTELGTANFRGQEYKIVGLHNGSPILINVYGEELVLDEESETLLIFQNEKNVHSIKYENFSGDWAVATFSPDGNLIAIGCPYDFVVYKRTTN